MGTSKINAYAKFVIVEWSESQQFIGCTDAYFSDDRKLQDSTYFVEENLYLFGREHPDLFGDELEAKYCTNKEKKG